MRQPKIEIVSGARFGRLTVIERAPNNGRYVQWLCLCDCGIMKTADAERLRRGKMKSCGCIHRENASMLAATWAQTHGMAHTRTYSIWRGMMNRCRNKKMQMWKHYGGRGIKVCERWQKFDNFYADMGEAPEGKSLDRYPNNDGHYEPKNCRWATEIEQKGNTSRARNFTLNGKTQCLAEWCRDLGMREAAVGRRLKRGWSLERALTEPSTKARRTHA